MKTVTTILALALLCACRKEEPLGPLPVPRPDVPYDHMVDGYRCTPTTVSDVYALQTHNDFPLLVPSGTRVYVCISGKPTNGVNGTVWSQACYALKVNDEVVASYEATMPECFEYVVQ